MNWTQTLSGITGVSSALQCLHFFVWHCENQALDNSFAAFAWQEAADYSWNEMLFGDATSKELMIDSDICFLITAAFSEDWKEALNMEENGVYLNYSLPLFSLIKFHKKHSIFISFDVAQKPVHIKIHSTQILKTDRQTRKDLVTAGGNHSGHKWLFHS